MEEAGVNPKHILPHYQFRKMIGLAWIDSAKYWPSRERCSTKEPAPKKRRKETLQRCTKVSDTTLDPVNGQLSCRLDIVNYAHLPVSELISSKPGACCQLHRWFMGVEHRGKKRKQLLYCEDCNVTLCSFCYKPFHAVKNLVAQKDDLRKMWQQ